MDSPEKPEADQPRLKKPEAIGFLAVEPKHERIGHMMLEAESGGDEKPKKEAFVGGEHLNGKRVDTLGRGELLALSEKIIIDGSSLRQIYETHLIGERGLRRLVTEYMHGGDLHEALKTEILEREMDFERDPVMRDMAPSVTASEVASSEALDKLLKKAEVSVDKVDKKEEAAFNKAKDDYEAKHGELRPQNQTKYLDIGMMLVIGILVLLIILILIRRS